jgi:uncharacterized protein (DUF58 family)
VTGAQFLDPRVLARIGDLQLVAKTVVEGFINGLHRSPYLGRSLDFAEHRAYMPGDDIRRVDWRVYGRTDRFYVKEFEADTNANFSVLLDVSRSMTYATAGLSKLDYGRYLAACLSYFSRQQRDRVGLVTFDQDVVALVPPSSRHLELVLHELARVEPGRGGPSASGLDAIARRLPRRSLVAVISDFYDDPEHVMRAIGALQAKGCDVIAFHILDVAELTLPFAGPVVLEDLETGERIPVVPERERDAYRDRIRQHVRILARGLGERGADYAVFQTVQPLDFALFEYLTRRERLARVR